MYDINKIRNDFPILKKSKTIYLDNAATTYKPQVVIDAVVEYLTKETANSGRSDYDDAHLVDVTVSETRTLVKSFINAASEEEIIFTSGTTMSLNLVAQALGGHILQKGDEILVSLAEHASNTLPWFEIAKVTGAKVVFVPLNEKGLVTPENIKNCMTSKTKIVSLAHVSNVLGYIHDVNAITKIVHDHGAFMVVDGAQSVPHLPIDVQALDIDFLAFSGHKMLAPTGIGVLYARKSAQAQMNPYFVGGGNNITYKTDGEISYFFGARKFEAGTLNIESIYGLNAAIKYIEQIGRENILAHEHELRKYAIAGLKKLSHIVLFNEDADTGIITFNVKGVHSQDAATYFNSRHIAVRGGMHCAKLIEGALKVEGTVRVSLYLYTSKEDIDAFLLAAVDAEDFLDAYFK